MQFLLPATFIVFLTLKLMGYIAWPWWVVFAPLYPMILAWIFFAVVAFLIIRD